MTFKAARKAANIRRGSAGWLHWTPLLTDGILRRLYDGLKRGFEPVRLLRSRRRREAFTMALVALAAKMAKADGVALRAEADAFERCFRLQPGQAVKVRRLFDLAKEDVAGFDIYARRLARLSNSDPEMLTTVMECLFHVATADGVLHEAEDDFLTVTATELGLSRDEFLTLRSTFVSDPASPYTILGVKPGVSDEELKARHRALVFEHHPDRLVSKGVPAEFLAAATRRIAAINAAYEAIRRERSTAGRLEHQS
jgi:DnaJ like chaperone protein